MNKCFNRNRKAIENKFLYQVVYFYGLKAKGKLYIRTHSALTRYLQDT